MWPSLVFVTTMALTCQPAAHERRQFRVRAVGLQKGSRRAACGLATATAAAAWAADDVVENPALVWREASSESACQAARTRRVFGGAFVSYLARFLLAYDKGSRAYWRSAADEIPLSWDEPRVRRRRAEQFAAFAASVEAGLCPYADKCMDKSGEPSSSPQLGVRQLLSLLRSRYGRLPDASRQLALTFSLLEPPFEPSDAVAALSAKSQNASVVAVDVVDAGAYAATKSEVGDAVLKARLGLPALAGYGFSGSTKPAKFASPALRPTGRILGFKVQDRGCGYETPPRVVVSPPRNGRPARGRAVIDAEGGVAAVNILDFGAGYDDLDACSVEIEAAADLSKCGTVAAVDAILEWEVAGVQLVDSNYGYTSAQPLDVAIASSLPVLRQPRLTVRLEENMSAKQRFADDFVLPRSTPSAPVAAAWAPRDAASSSLTTLLSPDYGVPSWDGTQHQFPARAFGAIKPARAVRREVKLTVADVSRLALAGALCTSATRAALNPLDLAKTRKQAGVPEQQNSLWLGLDATAASGAVLGACSFAAYELFRRDIPRVAVALTDNPALATEYELFFSLAASFGAVVLAAIGVTPFEAAKVRLMLGNDTQTLFGALSAMRAEGEVWSSFTPLLARELPFTTAKLITYSSAQTALFALLPAARERPIAALVVSCLSGILAGAAGAFLSAPADALVTELATGNHGSDWTKALDALLSSGGTKHADSEDFAAANDMVAVEPSPLRDGAHVTEDDDDHDRGLRAAGLVAALPRLFRGVKERMVLFAIIITVQLVLFDFSRSFLHVSPDNLSLSLDVFADRLSFYDY